MYGFDYICVYKYIYIYCNYTVFRLPTSTVSGAKTRYTWGNGEERERLKKRKLPLHTAALL